MKTLEYGAAPVPMTTEWGQEAGYYIAHCPHVGRLAFCQPERPGIAGDRPVFGHQHFNRQRRAAALGLCDLCGRPLQGRSKFSLSHSIAAADRSPVQVEPLVHRECGAISLSACPHLRRSVADGSLAIRRVTKYRMLIDIVPPAAVAEQVPDYDGPRTDVAGYALIELLQSMIVPYSEFAS